MIINFKGSNLTFALKKRVKTLGKNLYVHRLDYNPEIWELEEKKDYLAISIVVEEKTFLMSSKIQRKVNNLVIQLTMDDGTRNDVNFEDLTRGSYEGKTFIITNVQEAI